MTRVSRVVLPLPDQPTMPRTSKVGYCPGGTASALVGPMRGVRALV
jgi:hypothetical protein